MKKSEVYMYAIVAGMVSIPVGIFALLYYPTIEDVAINIDTKERVMKIKDGSTSYTYYAYTSDEVFEIKDDIYTLNFRSLDVFNNLKEERTCSVKVAGWRIGFLSKKRNVLEVYGCKENDND